MTAGVGAGHTHLWKKASLGINVSYINLKPNFAVINQAPGWVKPPEVKEFSLNYKIKTSATGILKFYSNSSFSNSSLTYNDLDSAKKDLFTMNNQQHYINSSYNGAINDKWLLFSGFAYTNNRDKIKIETK